MVVEEQGTLKQKQPVRGMLLDLLTLSDGLPAKRVDTFRTALTYGLCLKLLGLMASALGEISS